MRHGVEQRAFVAASMMVSLLAGCDGCGSAPERRTEAPARQPTEAEEALVVPPLPPPRERPPPLTPEQHARMVEARRARAAGRRLLRAGQLERAVASFRTAAGELDTPSVRCELGWALLRASEVDQARVELEEAIRQLEARPRLRDDERRTFGACLYNLGRLLEPIDPARAARMYRGSLEVRPDNQVVRARLDALSVPPAAEEECGPTACVGPSIDLEAFRVAVLADLLEQARDDLRDQGVPEDEERPAEQRIGVLSEPAPFGEGLEHTVVLAQVEIPYRSAYSRLRRKAIYAGMRTSAGWFACLLDHAEFEVGASAATGQWIPGGAPELTVDVDQYAVGHEEGISNVMGEVFRTFVGIEPGGTPVVYGAVRVSSYYEDGTWTNCRVEDEDDDEGEDGDGADTEDGESEEDECTWDPSACCDLEHISERTTFDVTRASRPGWIRILAEPPEGEPAPAPHEVEIRRSSCEPDERLWP